MDSPIRGVGYPPHYLPRPSRDRSEEEHKPFSLDQTEDDVVLEPQPRRDSGGVAVSRERLEDEAGQIIDLRG